MVAFQAPRDEAGFASFELLGKEAQAEVAVVVDEEGVLAVVAAPGLSTVSHDETGRDTQTRGAGHGGDGWRQGR